MRAAIIIALAAIAIALAAAVVLLSLALSGPARAADITPHERAVCLPEVRRLCPDEVARRDIPGGLACLVRNRERLSAACRKVLADHGI